MKISTRGRYALRMMLDMALADSGKPVRVKEIAERQEISEKYMEQIMSILNKASGRLFPDQKAGRVYSRHDSQTDRRKPKSGGLSGRRSRELPTAGKLCDIYPVETAE